MRVFLRRPDGKILVVPVALPTKNLVGVWSARVTPYLTTVRGQTTMWPEMAEQFPGRFLFPALLIGFFFSGAAGLIDQVVWSKALGLIFGHTAYAVATVLAVFMAGLASGSAWIGGRSDRWARPIALYGWLELGVAATAAISLAGLAGVRAAYVPRIHTPEKTLALC